MNTYYISADVHYTNEYVVEAESEEDAIHEVEYENVDPECTALDYIENIEVTDVEYGDVERYAKLGVTFLTRGVIEDDKLQDSLYSLLEKFDGKKVSYGDAELELVGFSVDHIDEV